MSEKLSRSVSEKGYDAGHEDKSPGSEDEIKLELDRLQGNFPVEEDKMTAKDS